ncbi:MAG TPA: hypothetical protein PKA53_03865 [Sphingobacterium sp.]|nr:hypothetical protein [Sphingobacterium sp.]
MDINFYIDRGVSLLENGAYTEALETFDKAEQWSGKILPEISFYKGLIWTRLFDQNNNEDYLYQAISLFSKAELHNEKYGNVAPVVSYNKGYALVQLFEYGEPKDTNILFSAIESFMKAERDSKGFYPKASSEIGYSYFKLFKCDPKKYYTYLQTAFEYFEKAEQDNGGKYAMSSMHKGEAFFELFQVNGNIDNLISSIHSFTKAELDNGGVFPDASCNKGKAYINKFKFSEVKNISDLDLAIACFRKAELDNGGLFPQASFDMGKAYMEKFEFLEVNNISALDLVIACFRKAELDNGGLFPKVSFDMGIAYFKRVEFSEDIEDLNLAIEYFGKAELDNGGLYPEASGNVGTAYLKRAEFSGDIQDLSLAIAYFDKVETDNNVGLLPQTSYNKGVAYMQKYNLSIDIGDIHKSIASYTKAERDNGGRYPNASCNKGLIYTFLEKTEEAINSFKKAINDSENQFFPKAYLQLAKIYRGIDIDQSEVYAFEAQKQDPYSIEIVAFVEEHFTQSSTASFYADRLNYLWNIVLNEGKKEKTTFLIGESNITKKLHEKERDYSSDIDLFYRVLFFEKIKLPVDINYLDRLRLAYIIAFFRGHTWDAFHILNNIIVETNWHAMDAYFALLSAYRVGEPMLALKRLSSLTIKTQDTFTTAYQDLSKEVRRAVECENKWDAYLIRVENQGMELQDIDLDSLYLHPWLKDALTKFIRPELGDYEVPVRKNQVNGLFVQFFLERREALEENLVTDEKGKLLWKVFLQALPDRNRADLFDIAVLTKTIRDAITDKVPLELIAAELWRRSCETDSEQWRRLYLIAVSIAYFSSRLDLKKLPLRDNSLETMLGLLVDISSVKDSAKENIASVVPIQALVSVGLDFFVGRFLKVALSIYTKNREKDINAFFKALEEEATLIFENNS